MLYREPEPLQMPLLGPSQTEADYEPLLAYVNHAQRQLLINDNVRCINGNETSVQPATVLEHVKDTYTPGDRLQKRRLASRKPAAKRQAPRWRGFPCFALDCEKTFDRACELK